MDDPRNTRVIVTVELIPPTPEPVKAFTAEPFSPQGSVELTPDFAERIVVNISHHAYMHLLEAWKHRNDGRPFFRGADYFGDIYTQGPDGVFRNIITAEELK